MLDCAGMHHKSRKNERSDHLCQKICVPLVYCKNANKKGSGWRGKRGVGRRGCLEGLIVGIIQTMLVVQLEVKQGGNSVK
jgi:hypothetical protein